MSVNIYKKETDTLQKVTGNAIGVAKFGEPIANWLTSANLGAANSKTADADGMVIVNVSGSGKGVIYEDGKDVSSTTLGSVGSSIVSPVRKGHKYALGATSSMTITSCFFYPFKEKQITNLKAEDKYSTDEIVVGEWIDGKPIYRKVVSFTGTIQGANSNVCKHNISNLLRVITLNANCNYNNQILLTESGLSGSTTADTGGFRIAGDYIVSIGNNIFSISSLWYFIIEYTKTTD